jgi:hypothetical protein
VNGSGLVYTESNPRSYPRKEFPEALMPDEVVRPPEVTKEMLHDLMEAAYMSVSYDGDGDVIVKEVYNIWLFPDNEGRRIWLMSSFRTKPEKSDAERLEYVNRVNDSLAMIRAFVKQGGAGIGFDYYIPVEGGITKQAIVLTVRTFARVLQSAIAQDNTDVLA